MKIIQEINRAVKKVLNDRTIEGDLTGTMKINFFRGSVTTVDLKDTIKMK